MRPKHVTNQERLTLDGSGSSDDRTAARDLTYAWDYHDGGTTTDATGQVVKKRFKRAGVHSVTLTVTDEAGNSDSLTRRIRVDRYQSCGGVRVIRRGSWRVVKDRTAPGGSYCDNKGPSHAKDIMKIAFRGPSLAIDFGKARDGGKAAVVIDGRRVGTLKFKGAGRKPSFHSTWRVGHLGNARHRARIVMLSKSGYVDAFVYRR